MKISDAIKILNAFNANEEIELAYVIKSASTVVWPADSEYFNQVLKHVDSAPQREIIPKMKLSKKLANMTVKDLQEWMHESAKLGSSDFKLEFYAFESILKRLDKAAKVIEIVEEGD